MWPTENVCFIFVCVFVWVSHTDEYVVDHLKTSEACRETLRVNRKFDYNLPMKQATENTSLLQWVSTKGDYQLWQGLFLTTHHLMEEGEKYASLCVSTEQVQSGTFGPFWKSMYTPQELLVGCVMKTSLDVPVGVLNVSRECWDQNRTASLCLDGARFLPVDGLLSTLLSLDTPVSDVFWQKLHDDILFDSLWLHDLEVYNMVGSLPSERMVHLNLTGLRKLLVTGNIWGAPTQLLSSLPSLETLDLSNNSLQSLPEDTFSNTPSLTNLQLSYNTFPGLPHGLQYLQHISTLNMSSSLSPLTISDSQMLFLDNIETLSLYNNTLNFSVPLLFDLPRLSVLNLSRCAISEIKMAPGTPVPEERTLRTLDLSLNELRTLSDPLLDRLTNLAWLSISGNGFHSCPRWNASSLQHLDLSRNLLERLEPSCFWNMTRLLYLSLADNRLSQITETLFQHLTSLKQLNLAHNRLIYLPHSTFLHLTSLLFLDLSSNNLVESPVLFNASLILLNISNNELTNINRLSTSLNHVTYLDLSFNSISDFNIDKVSTLNLSHNSISIISNRSLRMLSGAETIDLGGNRFMCCDSDITSLKRFVYSMNLTVLNLNDSADTFRCFLSNLNTSLPVSNYSFAEVCPKEEGGDLGWIIGMPVLLLCLLGAAVGLLYFYRYELTFIRHILIPLKRSKEDEAESYERCDYDAFVCYSGNNFLWVQNELVPELENGLEGYRLCLHDRDFTLGAFIDSNIIASLEKSRKVIIVLSQDFIASKWCQWELELANHKTFHQNRDYVILIELERLERKSMPRHLRYLMETRTYLEWPTDGASDRVVGRAWSRLKDALGESILTRTGRTIPKHCTVLGE